MFRSFYNIYIIFYVFYSIYAEITMGVNQISLCAILVLKSVVHRRLVHSHYKSLLTYDPKCEWGDDSSVDNHQFEINLK